MGRKKKTYSTDVKKKCIMELMEGKEFSKVCVENGVAPSTLSDWKKAFLSADSPPESRKTKSVWKVHSAEDIADTLNISVSLVKEWIEQNAPASTNNI